MASVKMIYAWFVTLKRDCEMFYKLFHLQVSCLYVAIFEKRRTDNSFHRSEGEGWGTQQQYNERLYKGLDCINSLFANQPHFVFSQTWYRDRIPNQVCYSWRWQ